jgi:hypothetical protein
MYKALKNFETLVENQEYTLQEIEAIYCDTTILTLISAGILEVIETKQTKVSKIVTE